jgi:hypothetical protein
MQTLLEAATTLGIEIEGDDVIKGYAQEIIRLDLSSILNPGLILIYLTRFFYPQKINNIFL